MAPEVGLEPTTLRLTVECSAVELQGIVFEANIQAETIIKASKSKAIIKPQKA